MKQRVGVAQAIFHDPGVLFLDEPTDGVDPLGRAKIRAILSRLKDQGKTIFINSHLLSEVELICDRVGILQRGEMIQEGDIETLTRHKDLYVIGLAPAQQLPEDELRGQGYRVRRAESVWEIELADGQSIDPVVDLVRARGLSVRHLMEKRQTLEDLFLKVVDDHEPGTDGPAGPRSAEDRIRRQP
jgi:ABC-2 type transport system ATP-binding protein